MPVRLRVVIGISVYVIPYHWMLVHYIDGIISITYNSSLHIFHCFHFKNFTFSHISARTHPPIRVMFSFLTYLTELQKQARSACRSGQCYRTVCFRERGRGRTTSGGPFKARRFNRLVLKPIVRRNRRFQVHYHTEE